MGQDVTSHSEATFVKLTVCCTDFFFPNICCFKGNLEGNLQGIDSAHIWANSTFDKGEQSPPY